MRGRATHEADQDGEQRFQTRHERRIAETPLFRRVHGGERGFERGLRAQSGVHQQMIMMAAGPLPAEVAANVGGALVIPAGDQGLGGGAGLALAFEALDSPSGGGVDKKMKGIAPVVEDVIAAAADDDAIAGGGDILNDAAGKLGHAIGIGRGILNDGRAFFAGRLPEALSDAVQPAFEALVGAAAGAGVEVGGTRDFVDQFPVQQAPLQAFRQLAGEVAGAAAEFPTYGEDAIIHGAPTWGARPRSKSGSTRCSGASAGSGWASATWARMACNWRTPSVRAAGPG